MPDLDRRVCVCGHRACDHLGAGRCDDPRKQCPCSQFRECPHTELKPWRITYPTERTRTVCATCGQVVDDRGAA